MKYSYEYKIKCVDLYRQRKWPKTPDGLDQKRFRNKIREWVRIEEARNRPIHVSKGQLLRQLHYGNLLWKIEERDILWI